MLVVKPRPLLEDQSVSGEVFGIQANGPAQRPHPVVEALTGEPEHYVQVDIEEAGGASQPEGLFGLMRAMRPTDPLQESVLDGLHAETETVDPTLPHCPQLRKIHRSWIFLKADLRPVLEHEGRSTVIKNTTDL